MNKEYKEWADAHFEEHLALLKRLASIPAPSHDEDRRVEFLLAWLKENGISAYEDGAKNVVIPMCAEGEGGAALITAHTDVVFPDTDSLPVEELGGRLYAPGVGDDTANVAAILALLRYIKEKGLKAKTPVIFALNSCEEGLGNLKGIKQLMHDLGGRIKEHISFDCAFEEGMIVRAVGSERWRVTARTRGGHSFNDFGAESAIHRVAGLVTELYKQKTPDIPGAKTTYNAGVISGGTTINTIAAEAELLYEYRSDDREALSLMRESFERILNEARAPGVSFEAEQIGQRPCGGEVDPAAQSKLIARCKSAIEKATGHEPEMSSGSTDANIPLSLGVPAVTFGLYSGAGMHTRQEWLDIASLKTGLVIALDTVIDEYFE